MRMRKKSPHYGALFRLPVRNQTPQIIYLSELIIQMWSPGRSSLLVARFPLQALRGRRWCELRQLRTVSWVLMPGTGQYLSSAPR